MLNSFDILETIKMIDDEHLDIRTITMGISLLDCISEELDTACNKIYDKICRKAERLVETGEQIESELGIPIINKRISVTPIALIGGATDADSYVPLAKTLNRAAQTCGVNFIGGFSALVQKGFAKGDEILIRSIPEALASTELVCSSVNVASTKAGINMDAVRMMGEVIRKTAELTAEQQCIGAGKLVVFANAVEDNPFMAGAFHGVGEADCVLNVGVSGPGVVHSAIRRAGDCSMNEVADIIKRPRSRSPVWVSWSARSPHSVWASRPASSICRSRQRRLSVTPWRVFWRRSVWNAAAHTARRQFLRCSTTQSKKAASWRPHRSAACPAHSSRYRRMKA